MNDWSLNNRPRPQPRFSGYTVSRDTQKARLFLPGHASLDAKAKESPVQAEYYAPNASGDSVELKSTGFKFDGQRWRSDAELPLGSQYRILVNGSPQLDLVETARRDNGDVFNVISPREATAPRRSGVIADIFLDALVGKDKLETLLGQDVEQKIRNHFNQYGGNEDGIRALLPLFRQARVQSILLKPFIGGDNLSSHRYWTKDPFVLNSSFSTKDAFRETLKQSLQNGMTFFADGAFVNQGLNGVQYMANLEHGFNSPYYDWFLHDQPRTLDGTVSYPRLAYEKPSLGILPTVKDEKTGILNINDERFDFRVENDPAKDGYQADRPTYIELYDPTVEDENGKLKPNPPETRTSEDSVQKYKFKVDPKELAEKRQRTNGLLDPERKRIWQEWKNFRLEVASHDDSMFKWDGQIDVAKMNMKNPEVRAYLKQAMGYWTRTVKNTYQDTIAQALKAVPADAAGPDWVKAVEGITCSDEEFKRKALPSGKVLPPVIDKDDERITEKEVKAALKTAAPSFQPAEEALGAWAVQTFPLPALEMPEAFKATLTLPDLQGRLATRRLPWLLSFLAPLESIGFLKPLLERLKPRNFQERVSNMLSQTLEGLDESTRRKLASANVQELLGDDVAETLYLQLLTGQTSRDRAAIEQGFYETVPASIRNANPKTGGRLLEDFLKRRLKKADGEVAKALQEELKARLQNLSPEALAVAELVTAKRELGLNWRIDAAKDVADMDSIRALEQEDRAPLFQQEMDFVQSFWAEMMGEVRKHSPKSVVIPEWTDFSRLSNEKIEVEMMQRLYREDTFNGTPNMRYAYSPFHRLVHYTQRTDEGGNRLKPSDFYSGTIRQMTQALPNPVVRQYQNMSASHDYLNSSHVMLVNPEIMMMDHLKWWGLSGDLKEISDELTTKACFGDAREALAQAGIPIAELPTVLAQLQTFLKENRQSFSEDVQTYFDKNTKEAKDPNGRKIASEPTPREVKTEFIQELIVKAQAAGAVTLSPPAATALQEALQERIAEPSEARAMRAVITNALLDYEEKAQDAGQGVQAAKVTQALYGALNAVIAKEGAHFGYQPLDVALDNLFKQPEAQAVLKANPDLKDQLYEQSMKPVYEKMLRMFAVQVGLPGNPSVYLPDLFAQGGGEFIKNIYVQNRNLIRHDLWNDKASAQKQEELDVENLTGSQFVAQAAKLLRVRADYPVFNGNNLLDMPDAALQECDAQGVLPMIHDNGKDRGILLVNTGKPEDADFFNNKVGETDANYRKIKATQHTTNIQLPLQHLDEPDETVYVDRDTKERFIVKAGRLVSENDHAKGVDVKLYRVLMRQKG